MAEPEKRVVTSMKVQDTFIVYLVETRLVFFVLLCLLYKIVCLPMTEIQNVFFMKCIFF